MSVSAVAVHGGRADSVATSARVLVFASLFPSSVQPGAGLFIRERMFRVGNELPLIVVSPKPWFPFQGIVRKLRPGYRPQPPKCEVQGGVEVYYPRFLSFPVIGRSLDGLSMALCCLPLMRKLKKRFQYNIVDAHFAYPDGYAATRLARWVGARVTITLRGTEVPLSRSLMRRRLMLSALARADRIFAVADSLKRHVAGLGADPRKIEVVGNGVDTDKFQRMTKAEARRKLGLPEHARVLITVGGLVPRKGFHRVIACLPALLREFPDLQYLIVGGASPEGNNERELRALVDELRLADSVHFLGSIAPDELKWPLSAADVFVLSTSNEGWANVLLEAMACGLPVVATDVGGNREVISDSSIGVIVPFDDHDALVDALNEALERRWDHSRIVNYARDNSWDSRVEILVREFQGLVELDYARKG